MPYARNSGLVDKILSKTWRADARHNTGSVCCIVAQTTIAIADDNGDWIGIAPISSDAVLLSVAIHHPVIGGASSHTLGLRRYSPDHATKLIDLSGSISLSAGARTDFDEVLFSSNNTTRTAYWGKAIWELPASPNNMTRDPAETFWLTHELATAGTAAGTVNWRILYTTGM